MSHQKTIITNKPDNKPTHRVSYPLVQLKLKKNADDSETAKYETVYHNAGVAWEKSDGFISGNFNGRPLDGWDGTFFLHPVEDEAGVPA